MSGGDPFSHVRLRSLCRFDQPINLREISDGSTLSGAC